MLDLALPNQILHRAGNVFDGHRRVNAMLIVEIDGIDLEPRQRPFDNCPDVLGTAIKETPALFVAGRGFPAELRRDHHLISERRERFADQFLIGKRAIDFGCVEESDAAFYRGM